jgi:hypothetical protein
MKDFVILVLVAIAFFAVLNGRNTPKVSTYAVSDVDPTAPVPPVIIQAIIETVQRSLPDMAPLETLFVNIQPDGSYSSRHMFYNTKHFYGTQYDVNAKVGEDGSVQILKIGDSAQVDPTTGYKPDLYQPWKAVESNLDSQFKGALVGYKNQPPQPNLNNLTKAYGQNMILAESNLMTRS